MATAEDLRSIALSFPDATEKPMHGTPAFYVRTKFFTKLSHDGRTAVLHVEVWRRRQRCSWRSQ